MCRMTSIPGDSSDAGARTRVAVIFGGRSSEHDVSCRSAASVFRALDPTRYEVVPIRISREGVWQFVEDAVAEPPRPEISAMQSIAEALVTLRSVDVAFPCLHGPYGEDGTIQALLELAGVRYVGSGVLASATSMDKEFTKRIVASEGIAVADGVVLREGESEVSAADRERLGLPVFVKPARSGSSVGVSRVDEWDQLEQAVIEARKCDGKVLVEAAVVGREVDIAVLELPSGEVTTGPPLEINVHGAGFFDFDAKYFAGTAEFVIPAQIPAEHAELLADTARRVFEILGCAGLLRADFFLTEVDGETVAVLNEVNTMPGFTEKSQYPQIWQAAGVSYSALLDRMISTALAGARVPALTA
jgi:D-alanine-D-alanine ligase